MQEQPIPFGFCECGCGRKTALATQTHGDRGQVKGQPVRFIKGHSGHKFAPGELAKPDRWSVEDRGYVTPCWVWLLYTDHGGYGAHGADGRVQKAHRYYYEQRHGRLPRRVQLDHLCRNPACVNPDHLEPVTNAENCRRSRNAKLTYATAAEVRSLAEQGWNLADIGPSYGITDVQAGNIARGRSWSESNRYVSERLVSENGET